VLFSFNGLDYVDHDERLASLKEIRRICALQGYFCFSSHNLQCLPDFLRVHFPWNPVAFVKGIVNRRRLRRRNREQIERLSRADHVIIFDDVYDFGLHTYYVRPSHQIAELRKAGFGTVRLFDLTQGKELTEPAQYDATVDSWIYYLCR
jgi:hypothetical protein